MEVLGEMAAGDVFTARRVDGQIDKLIVLWGRREPGRAIYPTWDSLCLVDFDVRDDFDFGRFED